MEGSRLKLKCSQCSKIGVNAFPHPFDWNECIGVYHSPRSEKEYYWKCPHCGCIAIFPELPKDKAIY